MLNTIISSAISAVVSGGLFGGLGYYVRGRGMTGTQNDLNNAKNEIEKLKDQVIAAINAAKTVA